MSTGVLRKIVQIDEELCDGCGVCVPSCAEGAIQIIDGKARLVDERFCDGLGACLGDCPQDAINIIERAAEDFDEELVHEHLKKIGSSGEHKTVAQTQPAPPATGRQPQFTGCPSAQMRDFSDMPQAEEEAVGHVPSQLRQWPIQLGLVSPMAPYFQNADFMLVADCVPFAYAGFHGDLLKGKAIAIACPKLDNPQGYVEKLAQLIKTAEPRSISVAIMEVPCCYGLKALMEEAVSLAGSNLPVNVEILGIGGEKKQGL